MISEVRSLKVQLRDVAQQPKAAQVPRQPICHCGLAEGKQHRQNSEELSGEVPQAWAAPARDAWGGVCLWWLGSLPFVVSGALAARPSWPYSRSQPVIAADRARPRPSPFHRCLKESSSATRPPALPARPGAATTPDSCRCSRCQLAARIVPPARLSVWRPPPVSSGAGLELHGWTVGDSWSCVCCIEGVGSLCPGSGGL